MERRKQKYKTFELFTSIQKLLKFITMLGENQQNKQILFHRLKEPEIYSGL